MTEKVKIITTPDDAVWAKIHAQVTASKFPAIITHARPDADAYGSTLGLAHALKALGITTVVVNEDPTHSKYAFFPGSDKIVQQLPSNTDYLMVLDCGDPKRVGDSLKDLVVKFENKICIDHHVSNMGFGDPCVVATTLSSTSEIIYRLVSYLERVTEKKLITQECATCLFTGLYGDTGGFRFPTTGVASFEMAAALLQRGAQPATIVEQYLGSRSWSQVKIQSEALLQASTLCGGRVVEIVVPDALVKKYGGDWIDTEGLVDQARDIEGTEVAVFINHDKAITKVSLRSRTNAIPVNTLAEEFGGGGHRNAAGFKSKLTIPEVQAILRKRLEELLCKK